MINPTVEPTLKSDLTVDITSQAHKSELASDHSYMTFVHHNEGVVPQQIVSFSSMYFVDVLFTEVDRTKGLISQGSMCKNMPV